MNTENQQRREQEIRDEIDYLVNDEHYEDGAATDWRIRLSTAHHAKAPNACHPNQTVIEHKDGSRYLVNVSMLRPPTRKIV